MPPKLAHEPYTDVVDAYTTALRSIAACRKLAERLDALWEDDLMDRLLEDVEFRQQLDWRALTDAVEEAIFGGQSDEDVPGV